MHRTTVAASAVSQCRCADTYTHAVRYIYTYYHIHMLSDTYTHTITRFRQCRCADTYTHAVRYIYTYYHIHILSDAYTHTIIYTYEHRHMCINACALACVRAHTHAFEWVRLRAHARQLCEYIYRYICACVYAGAW